MELVSIQYLRGCAALMIVVLHLEIQLGRMGYHGYWPHFLSCGVDIFFVVSGFIMWITTANGTTTMEFYRRRLIRIVPLYWLLTTVFLIVMIAFPRAIQTGRFEHFHVLGSYLFVPVVHPVTGAMQPVLIPGWTLNYEMFFYLIFGLSLLLPAVPRLLATSAILLGLVLIPAFTAIDPRTITGFYTSTIILEFALGMALGWLFTRGMKFHRALAWAVLLIGVGALVFVDDFSLPGVLSVGVPALLVVAGSVMIERENGVATSRGLHLLGNASYSLYLSHGMALSFFGQAWRELPIPPFSGITLVFAGLATATAIVLGVLIHLYIEIPLLQVGRLRFLKANTAS